MDLQTRVNTAVILAGGSGIRLQPLTNNRPKPMIEVLGKPILEWTLRWLKNHGITNIVLGVAYKKEAIIDYFGDGSKFGLNIKYSEHSVEGETGEGFRLAISRHVKEENFVAMNGDELSNLNLKKLIEFHLSHKAVATIVVSPLKSPFGIINVDKDDSIITFIEKPTIENLLISTGIYVFNRKILDYLPEKGNIEKTTFPLLTNNKLAKAYRLDERWVTINSLKDIQFAEELLPGWREYN